MRRRDVIAAGLRLAGCEAVNGFALFAPARTPMPLLCRVNEASKTAMRQP